MFRERIRVRFARKGDVRFVAHQDLMRVFERALRRTGLPLRLTEGFNRHIRLSFPLPLAVGWEAENEAMEFDLADWISAKEVQTRLAEQLPPGLTVTAMTLVPPLRRETGQVVEAEYRVTPVSDELGKRLSQEVIDAFLKRDEFEVERVRKDRTKRVNVRPYILELRLNGEGLTMRMGVSQDGTSRPEEVLEGLGFGPAEARDGFRIVRTRVKLREDL